MRYLVIVYDSDELTWYAPLIEAPNEKQALVAAAEKYPNCHVVTTLSKADLEFYLGIIKTEKPDIIVGDDPDPNLIKEWVRIGQENPWISRAVDPPFDETMFVECESLEELYDRLKTGWCVGTAFYLGTLAFINQVDGGDEWLVIRGTVPFESITAHAMSFDRFREWYERVMRASDKDLARLKY